MFGYLLQYFYDVPHLRLASSVTCRDSEFTFWDPKANLLVTLKTLEQLEICPFFLMKTPRLHYCRDLTKFKSTVFPLTSTPGAFSISKL